MRTGEQAWQGQASLPAAPLPNPISAKSQRGAALLAGSVVIFLCARTQALELRKSEHRSRPQPCDRQTLFRGVKTHRCAEQRTESFGQCYRTAQPAAAPKTRELEALSHLLLPTSCVSLKQSEHTICLTKRSEVQKNFTPKSDLLFRLRKGLLGLPNF